MPVRPRLVRERLPRVLRHRAFRFLWLSQLISQVGDRLTLVVLALAVTELGSPSDVGLVLAARFGPLVLLLLFGGVWADRLPRRAVMIVTDLARFVLHAVLAGLFLAGVVEVWQVAVIQALFAAAEAFSLPAYQGLIPQTVPEEEVQQATALSMLSRNLGQLVGPAIGTAIFVAAGAGWAFAVDAASFAVAAALLVFVTARRRGEPVARSGVLHEIADGFREVRSRTWLWVTVLVANVWIFTLEAPFAVLGPSLADDAYGDSARFGLAMSALGAGLVAGTVVAARIRPARPLITGFVAITALPLAYLAFALGAPFGATLAGLVVAGAGASVFDVLWLTTMAREIPPHALSRVISFDYMGSYASIPLGYLAAGPLAEQVGPEGVLIAGVVVWLVLTVVALLVPGVRALRGPGRAPGPPAASLRP